MNGTIKSQFPFALLQFSWRSSVCDFLVTSISALQPSGACLEYAPQKAQGEEYCPC